MEESQTWRQLLLKIILDDLNEHERLLKELTIDSRTLDRWVKGISNPRPQLLLMLLRALPAYDYLLPDLVAKEFPETVEQYRQARVFIEPEVVIPTILYERILHQRSTALHPVALWGICNMSLQKLVSQLTQQHVASGQSVTAVVVRCVPPDGNEQSVKLLREYAMDASNRELLRRPLYFFGVDSLAGAVVETSQPQICNEMSTCVAPDPFMASMQSVVAYPICQEGNVAGCLLVSSSQSHFFSTKMTELVAKYAHLLALAFREQDFYPKSALALQGVHHPETQLTLLKEVKERVQRMLYQAELRQEFLSYTQAEQRVIEQLLQEERQE